MVFWYIFKNRLSNKTNKPWFVTFANLYYVNSPWLISSYQWCDWIHWMQSWEYTQSAHGCHDELTSVHQCMVAHIQRLIMWGEKGMANAGQLRRDFPGVGWHCCQAGTRAQHFHLPNSVSFATLPSTGILQCPWEHSLISNLHATLCLLPREPNLWQSFLSFNNHFLHLHVYFHRFSPALKKKPHMLLNFCKTENLI